MCLCDFAKYEVDKNCVLKPSLLSSVIISAINVPKLYKKLR